MLAANHDCRCRSSGGTYRRCFVKVPSLECLCVVGDDDGDGDDLHDDDDYSFGCVLDGNCGC